MIILLDVKLISYLYSLVPFLNIAYKLIGSLFLKNDDNGICSSSFNLNDWIVKNPRNDKAFSTFVFPDALAPLIANKLDTDLPFSLKLTWKPSLKE